MDIDKQIADLSARIKTLTAERSNLIKQRKALIPLSSKKREAHIRGVEVLRLGKERSLAALRMRGEGLTYREVGKRLAWAKSPNGVSTQQARNLTRQALYRTLRLMTPLPTDLYEAALKIDPAWTQRWLGDKSPNLSPANPA